MATTTKQYSQSTIDDYNQSAGNAGQSGHAMPKPPWEQGGGTDDSSAMGSEETPADPGDPGGGGGGIDPPPPPIPQGPPSESPLALTGSFAQPGTQAAKAFRTGSFLSNRLVSGGGGDGMPLRFSAGTDFGASPLGSPSALTGGGDDGTGGGKPPGDDMVRAIMAALRGPGSKVRR